MTWEYSDEFYKEYTRETWNASVGAYPIWQDVLEPYTAPLLEAAGVEAGHRVLDMATGPGLPALDIAELVGPEGEVVGIDLSDAMIELAQRRAKEQEVGNVAFEVMDVEDLSFEDGSFDRVVSRFGLQIFTAPETALEEAHRVLKPGGRFAGAVWAAPGEKSPAIHAIIGPMLRHCEPDEDGYLPTPYEVGGPGILAGMMEDAGFEQVATERRTFGLVFADADEYLEAMLDGTPVGPSLEEEDPAIQAAVIEETRGNVERWGSPGEDGGIVLEGQALFATGRRGA